MGIAAVRQLHFENVAAEIAQEAACIGTCDVTADIDANSSFENLPDIILLEASSYSRQTGGTRLGESRGSRHQR